MKLIKSLLSQAGSISFTRFVGLITVFSILSVFLGLNIVALYRGLFCSGEIIFVDMPSNCVMTLLIVLGAKVAQKPFEKPEQLTSEPSNQEGQPQ